MSRCTKPEHCLTPDACQKQGDCLKTITPKAAPTPSGQREATLRCALQDIADGPQPIEDYKYGLRCGVEDRDLQSASAYVAAEYGYEQGLDWCADIAARALKDATLPADEGSVRLPVEPTPEMIQAWHDRHIEGANYIDRNSIEYALYVECYRAMLAAAKGRT